MNSKNFKSNIVFTTIVIATLSLSGCGTMSLSKEQCMSGNWDAIGHNDGILGRLPSRISLHQEACAETGIIPNFKAWEAGRKRGLVHYCTETNARSLGQRGQVLNPVCPAKQVKQLQSIHNKAYSEYRRQKEIRRDTRKLEKYQNELSQLRSGEMLKFKTEIQARAYMLKIQKEMLVLEKRIRKNKRASVAK